MANREVGVLARQISWLECVPQTPGYGFHPWSRHIAENHAGWILGQGPYKNQPMNA